MLKTFIDSYGRKRTYPTSTIYLSDRTINHVLGEVLETLQRIKDKHISTTPTVVPEHIAIELSVHFTTIRAVFFHLQRSGLLERVDNIALPIGNSIVYKILRDTKETDLHCNKSNFKTKSVCSI